MELMEAIRERRSIRKYLPDPVADVDLATVLEAARLAPTAANKQPFKIIVVQHPQLREQLVPACNGQKFIAEAPVVLVGCAMEDQAYPKQGGYMNTFAVDTTIVFDHIILAAVGRGLGTCWIGAFDEGRVREVLGIPDNVRVVCLTPLGHPAESPEQRGRKPLKDLVAHDRW
jgi:nitroreductase